MNKGYWCGPLKCNANNWSRERLFPITSTILSVAQTIYTNQTFDELPILADALEEVGCTDESVLRHCRGFTLTKEQPKRKFKGRNRLLLDKEGKYTVKRCPDHPRYKGDYNPAGMFAHKAGMPFWDGSRGCCEECWRVFIQTASPNDMDKMKRVDVWQKTELQHVRGCWVLDLILGKE